MVHKEDKRGYNTSSGQKLIKEETFPSEEEYEAETTTQYSQINLTNGGWARAERL